MAAPICGRVLYKLKTLVDIHHVHILNKRSYTIRKILADGLCNPNRLTVQGWIRSVRCHKDVMFMHINDGSCQQHLQVVASPTLNNSDLTFGSSVKVEGVLCESKGGKQDVELQATSVQVQGPCDHKQFPIKQGKNHPVDYLRQYLHLRPRTQTFSALCRIRSEATKAIHEYFQNNEYCQVHTPIITSNDCEGAGEVFTLEPSDKSTLDMKNGGQSSTEHFFNTPAFLTVSGQLHLEVMTGAIAKVYTFGPTFRAENSRSRHHLSEFYMVEAEIAFIDSLEFILQTLENLFKESCQKVLDRCAEDVALIHRKMASKNHQEIMDKALSTKSFQRLSYTEAIEILERASEKFSFKPKWGCDLQREHERYLIKHCGNIPLFVVDFPADIKPFYARQNDAGKTVAAVDMLAPGVGEIVGGSLREENLEVLQERLERLKLTDSYQWYLDLRRFGTIPHGGFGLGFERFLQTLLGIENIKDTIIFPRFTHNCKM